MNTDIDSIVTLLFGLPWRELVFIILFVIVSTLALTAAFGIAWPALQWGRKHVKQWKDYPWWAKWWWIGKYVTVAIFSIATVVLDWLVNLVVASLVFKRMPNGTSDVWGIRMPWLQLLTGRIQGYLYEWSADIKDIKMGRILVPRFNWHQQLYIKFVVKVANRIDKTPHFFIPVNLRKVVTG